jgi:outer membrane phospholipase A
MREGSTPVRAPLTVVNTRKPVGRRFHRMDWTPESPMQAPALAFPRPVAIAPLLARIALAVLIAAVSIGARGDDEVPTRDIVSKERFGVFEDNFGLLNQMKNNGWAGNDEAALRAHYSFRYSVYRFGRAHWLRDQESEVFLAYTGEFDFYMATRTSSPVINRISNPAVHFRTCGSCAGDTWQTWLDFALEHRSNGQVGDVESTQGAAEAQAAYDARDREYFDRISRGSNYFSLTLYTPEPLHIGGATLRTRAKVYLTQSTQVTWGPLANRGVRIADYDRASLLWRQKLPAVFGRSTRLEVEWIVGDSGLKTDSLNVGLHFNVNRSFPFYARLHIGPLNTLSNYTQRQDSIGIGLRFDD